MYTRQQVKALQATLKSLLAEPANKAKLEAAGFEMTGESKGTYGDSLSVKLSFGLAGADREAMAKAEFARMAHLFGCKAEDYNRELVLGGVKFRLTGFRIQAPVKPYLITNVVSGKTHIATRGHMVMAGVVAR